MVTVKVMRTGSGQAAGNEARGNKNSKQAATGGCQKVQREGTWERSHEV